MDWKWWLPFFVSVANLLLVYRQTQLMKPQPASTNSMLRDKLRTYWPLIAMAILICVTWLPYLFDQSGNHFLTMKQFDQKPVKTVNCHGRKKVNEKVSLDGMVYRNCVFENVTFVYNGTAPFSLSDGNTFIGSKHLESDSGMVNYTLRLIRDFGWISGKLNVQDEIPSPEGN